MVPLTYDFRPQASRDEEAAQFAAFTAARRNRALQNPLLPPSDSAPNSVVSAVGQAAGNPIDPFAPSWPTFATEAHRNIAMANGSFDPSFPSPIAKTSALALGTIRQRDMDERASYDASIADRTGSVIPKYDYSQYYNVDGPTVPDDYKPPLLNGSQILRTQMAGDSRGDVGRVLRSRAGESTSTIGAFSPYIPTKNAGSILDVAGQDTLDRDLFDDPEFQRVYKTDPHRADFVYQRLTGRQLFGAPDKEGNRTTGDLPRSLAYRDSRAKAAQTEQDFIQHTGIANALDLQKTQTQKQIDLSQLPDTTGRDYVKRNLDAQFDQNTGKWKVFNRSESDGGTGFGTAGPKVSNELIPANEAQSYMLNRHWAEVTGTKVPEKMNYGPKEIHSMAADEQIPELKSIFDTKEKQYGHPLTFKDKQLLKGQYYQQQANQNSQGVLSYMQAAGNAVLGLKGQTSTGLPIDPFNPGLLKDENLNWLGKLLYGDPGNDLTPDQKAAMIARPRNTKPIFDWLDPK